jgi:biopolymer transport protein ExbB/TolQ
VDAGLLDSMLPGSEAVTWLVSGLSLAAVWLPFVRGMRLSLQAWAATRRVPLSELRGAGRDLARENGGSGIEPISLLMLRILRKALRENEKEGHPTDFIFDATRQYVINEYDDHYTRLIGMYASLLPPLGFIGTTGGMLILFLSMHLGSESLEIGALAMALTSTVFALIAYAILDGFKIRLYGRLLACVADVRSLFREADAQREQERRGPDRPLTGRRVVAAS